MSLRAAWEGALGYPAIRKGGGVAPPALARPAKAQAGQAGALPETLPPMSRQG